MHSSELPVTEWWDPADDVYGVPPCPQGDGRTDASLWTEAFLFAAIIGWIWADYDGYWGRWTRQLTTGADATPTPCACYYAGSTWHDGPMVREYHLEQNPDCPLHWCPSWLAPCSCEYALHQVIWYPTHLIDVPGVGQRGAAYTFRIDPWCPHHGAEDEFGRMPAAELVLDEDERRGH